MKFQQVDPGEWDAAEPSAVEEESSIRGVSSATPDSGEQMDPATRLSAAASLLTCDIGRDAASASESIAALMQRIADRNRKSTDFGHPAPPPPPTTFRADRFGSPPPEGAAE
ncbi:hypothetical protein [Nocardiopsis rhodophaea]|uniref:hypothetical protein n=2 Tax=Nocardiopsis rhodophaea TaxID=280238 RepID=UPI0031D20779